MNFGWVDKPLKLWVTFIGDKEECAMQEEMTKTFDYDVVGKCECILAVKWKGCRMERNCDNNLLKMTKPVLLQSSAVNLIPLIRVLNRGH